jgi:hypothetical protein
MKLLLDSPACNLLGGVIFVLTVGSLAVVGYVSQGWSFGDALYMVVLTVFTVGYDEVQPVTAGPLRAITIGLIVTGCTGMIFLTGALVQFITITGIQQVLGIKHMSHQIEHLRDHVIVCGFGRIGNMLARELKAGEARFVVVERSMRTPAMKRRCSGRASRSRAGPRHRSARRCGQCFRHSQRAQSEQNSDDHRARRVAIDGDQTVIGRRQ